MVHVPGIERGRGEREPDAEHADENLVDDHVDDRPHAAEPHPAADRREQVPPVERPRDREADVLEDVDVVVRERVVVQRRDVPELHHEHVEDDREGGVAEEARPALDRGHPTHHRPQDPLRQARIRRIGVEVEQQQVLDHVHHSRSRRERVDRRDQRGEDAQHRPREQREAAAAGRVRLARAPGASTSP